MSGHVTSDQRLLQAYSVESGSTGIAFKCTDRYVTVEATSSDIRSEQGTFLVAVLPEALDTPVGCVNLKWQSSDDSSDSAVGHYGPFAVSSRCQGRGVGTALLESVDAACRQRNCSRVDIEVVNLRTDILPYYERRGYVRQGTIPYDSAHGFDETALTRPCHFVLMSKFL